MNELILHLLSSFALSFLSFPLFIKLMKTWRIFEQTNSRKIHDRDVPGLGGVPIIISALLTILFFFPLETIGYYKYFIASLVFVLLVGLRDDLLPLSPVTKTINQVIPCLIVYLLFDIKINSLYSLYDVQLPEYVALPLTLFTMIIVTNSFNLIDGIDGLAGSLMIITLASLAGLFLIFENTTYGLLIICFIGALAGFLFFNLPPAKIFMGDTGALLLGFLIACSLILFMNLNSNLEYPLFKGTVGAAISMVGVPLFDTFRIIIYRLWSGKSPLEADRNHIHHKLLDIGWQHKHITLGFAFVQLVTIVLAFLLREFSDWVMFAMMGLLYSVLLFLIKRARKKVLMS